MPQGNGKKKDAKKDVTRKFDITHLKHRNSPQFVSGYANSSNAASSFYDVRLTFGQVITGLPNENAYIEDFASVTMTWEHAIRLKELLDKIMATYQSENGSIRFQEQK